MVDTGKNEQHAMLSIFFLSLYCFTDRSGGGGGGSGGLGGRLGLTMQLANNLSVLSSTLSSTLGYGSASATSYDDPSATDLASPVRQEDEDDSDGDEPMLSGELWR